MEDKKKFFFSKPNQFSLRCKHMIKYAHVNTQLLQWLCIFLQKKIKENKS